MRKCSLSIKKFVNAKRLKRVVITYGVNRFNFPLHKPAVYIVLSEKETYLSCGIFCKREIAL